MIPLGVMDKIILHQTLTFLYCLYFNVNYLLEKLDIPDFPS